MTARAGLCAAVLFGFASSALAQRCPGPAGFNQWLQGFKQQAIAEGISPQTVSASLNGVTYDPRTIARDRAQGVFAQDFLTFMGRMVSNNRMSVGKAMLQKYASVFKRIEQQYGVPGPVLVAYWGLDALEYRGVFLKHRLSDIHAVIGDHPPHEGQKVLRKDALGAIPRDRPRIVSHAVQCGRDGLGRDAFGDSLLLEALEPLIEAGRAWTTLCQRA